VELVYGAVHLLKRLRTVTAEIMRGALQLLASLTQ
jgi:hypothetical protein